MSYYNHQQTPVIYPPPATHSYPPMAPGQPYPPPLMAQPHYPLPGQGPYVVPPPVAYPMKHGVEVPHHQQPPPQTKQRGGFFRGCCAALCCCCLLDMCCF